MKTTIALLLAVTAFSAPALAQTSAPATSTTTTMAAPMVSGEWRASKLVGVNVYNEQNNSVGEIDEVLVDHTGKIAGFVVGVGGFLGMGEHDVLIPFNQVKFVNEPVRTTSTTSPPSKTTGAASNTTTKVRDKNEKWYPDHAVINATKDQLKAMQQFKY